MNYKIDKEFMWIIVGTLQIVEKQSNKLSIEERETCLINLLQLGSLRFNASMHEHTMYYKLILNLIKTFKDKSSEPILKYSAVPIKLWFNVLSLSTDPDLYLMTLKFIEDAFSSSYMKNKGEQLVHIILVWFSDLNSNKDINEKLKESVFEGLYDHNTELFSSHYCQAIDLFLGTFRADSDDAESNNLVSNIFTNIMSALNKPSKSASFAKIWNELFKCLAIIGNNEENVEQFVSTFLSLPGDIQDNLYTHFETNNINLNSAKNK
jgi:hypothetical protein